MSAQAVPLACRFGPHEGGQAVAAIPAESCGYALVLARQVWRGLLPEDDAFAAVAVHAADRSFACAPEHLARFVREAVREGVRVWEARAVRARSDIGRVVWPMARRRAPGEMILAAAEAENVKHERPLSEDEVLQECRAIARASMGRSANARGR